jgi:hypothetical protein
VCAHYRLEIHEEQDGDHWRRKDYQKQDKPPKDGPPYLSVFAAFRHFGQGIKFKETLKIEK